MSRILHRSLHDDPPLALAVAACAPLRRGRARDHRRLGRRRRRLPRPWQCSGSTRRSSAQLDRGRLCPHRPVQQPRRRGAGGHAAGGRAGRADPCLLRLVRLGGDGGGPQARAAVFPGNRPAAAARTFIARRHELSRQHAGCAWRPAATRCGARPTRRCWSDAFSHVSPCLRLPLPATTARATAHYVARLAGRAGGRVPATSAPTVSRRSVAEPVVGATTGCVTAPAGYFPRACARSATATARC